MNKIKIILLVVLVLTGVFFLGPKPVVDTTIHEIDLSGDLDEYLKNKKQ